jgi:YD repeat-containing protein
VGANQGDLMRLIFTRLSDNFSPQVELYTPAGLRLTANSDISQKAPANGGYLVLVGPSSSASETGSFTLAYQRPNTPCTPVTLTCGQSTLRQASIPGQVDTFSFTGTGGDLANIRLTSRSGAYSPFVEMYDSSGNRLGSTSAGLLRPVLPADGSYTLLVRDRNGVNLGSYRVALQDDSNTCSVDDSERPALALVRPTGGEVLAGGTVVRIQWLSDDNVGVAAHDVVLSTDGGRTFGANIAGGLSGNAQSYDWTLPSDIAPSRNAVIRVTATDAAGNAQSVASDLLSLIGSGFPANSTVTFTYDALNRPVQTVLGDGRAIQYTWDASGNLLQITITGQ